MARKFLFYLIMLGFVFVTLECFALLVNTLKDQDDIYDQRAGVLERLNAADLARFASVSGDPVLGWDHRGPRVDQGTACTGQKVTYTLDESGARTYAGYDRDQVKILAVGDSFTNGAEAADDQAYPAVLASLLGVTVANHGVGGYGPVQAFLNLKQKAGLYPQARVAILGIMYENVYRMVNSYRPVLYENAFDYGLKPYIADGEIHPYPGAQVLQDIELFKKAAGSSFDQDFWAKPKPQFPYFVSLLRGFGSNYFYYLRWQKKLRKWDVPEYYLTFRSELFASELVSLLDHYTQFARDADLVPVVVFIPRNGYDTESVGIFIEENRSRFPEGLVVGDVGSAEIDWSAFNLIDSQSGDACHPSQYGYSRIAAYVAGLLRDKGVSAQLASGLSVNASPSPHQPQVP